MRNKNELEDILEIKGELITVGPRSMNLMATSSPLFLSLQRFATPKLPAPNSLINSYFSIFNPQNQYQYQRVEILRTVCVLGGQIISSQLMHTKPSSYLFNIIWQIKVSFSLHFLINLSFSYLQKLPLTKGVGVVL